MGGKKRCCPPARRYGARKGLLARQPCEVCGEIKAEAHHADYSQPLEVRWALPNPPYDPTPERRPVNLQLENKDVVLIAEAVAERINNLPPRQWLTKAEAAEHLRCSTKQIDLYVRVGDIPVYRPGGERGRPLFSADSLDKFVRQTERG